MRSKLPHYLLAGIFGAVAVLLFSRDRSAAHAADEDDDDGVDSGAPEGYVADAGPSFW